MKRSSSSGWRKHLKTTWGRHAWYQRFLHTYDTVRPHMGINMLTPKRAIALYHKTWENKPDLKEAAEVKNR